MSPFSNMLLKCIHLFLYKPLVYMEFHNFIVTHVLHLGFQWRLPPWTHLWREMGPIKCVTTVTWKDRELLFGLRPRSKTKTKDQPCAHCLDHQWHCWKYDEKFIYFIYLRAITKVFIYIVEGSAQSLAIYI